MTTYLWNAFQNIIKPPAVAEDLRKKAVLLSTKEIYKNVTLPGSIELCWTIQNQSTTSWENSCILRNHNEDDAYVSPLFAKTALKPNETKHIFLNLYLPKTFKKEKVVLLLQFETPNAERFGEPFIVIVDID